MTCLGSKRSQPPMKPRTRVTQKWKGIRKALLHVAIPVALASASFAAAPLQSRDAEIGVSRHGKFARDLDRRNPNALVRVIVQFKTAPQSRHFQKMSADGAMLNTKLTSIRAAVFTLPVSAVAKLEKNPDVLYVSPDRPVHLTAAYETFE